MNAASFEVIASLLRARSGLVIGPDKLYLLETRLGALIRREGLRNLDDLATRLRAPNAEPLIRDTVEAMTTNESFFFRDEKPFAHVRQAALPRLLAARPPGSTLRIWSAAASTGQESYSLAMLLSELSGGAAPARTEIIGTDIAREPLARAREGLYTQFEVQRGVPVTMLLRHFAKEDAQWRISKKLRDMVQFKEWNLLADLRPLGQFDIVFLRNVLIYFDAPTKTKVLEAVARQMAPDGYLYLGGAETVLGLTDRLRAVPDSPGVFSPGGGAALTPPASATTLAAASAAAGLARPGAAMHSPTRPAPPARPVPDPNWRLART